MRVDLGLLGEMMLALEEDPRLDGRMIQLVYPNELFLSMAHEHIDLGAHLQILLDEGLIQGDAVASTGQVRVWRLSEEGREFIEAVRSRDTWDQAIQLARANHTESLSFVCSTAAQRQERP